MMQSAVGIPTRSRNHLPKLVVLQAGHQVPALAALLAPVRADHRQAQAAASPLAELAPDRSSCAVSEKSLTALSREFHSIS